MKWTRSSKCESTHCVEWRKSTRSSESANCVEWRTASRCHENGSCVEVSTCDCSEPTAQVRDSKLVADSINISPVLTFDARSWRQFIGWVSRG